MQTLHAPELREQGQRDLIQTRTGLVIGGAFVRKPEPMTADAEILQRALLTPIRHRFIHKRIAEAQAAKRVNT